MSVLTYNKNVMSLLRTGRLRGGGPPVYPFVVFSLFECFLLLSLTLWLKLVVKDLKGRMVGWMDGWIGLSFNWQLCHASHAPPTFW